MPPESFAFRASCYTEFGWTPDVVRSLPYSEALLLAVYFEEVGRIRRKQANDANGGHSTSGSGWHDDLVVDAEDDEEDEA